MKEVKVKENSRLAQIAARYLKSDNVAMVIGNTVHLFGVKTDDFLSSKTWVRHELKHVEQVKRMGLVPFLLSYMWESVRHGYYNNKYEKEARAAEGDEEIATRYYFNIGGEEKFLA